MQKFCKNYNVNSQNILYESDYRKAMLSFIRKTGLFFSENIFEENLGNNVRCIPLEGIKSGLMLAWLHEDLNFAVKEIIQYVQRTHKS